MQYLVSTADTDGSKYSAGYTSMHFQLFMS